MIVNHAFQNQEMHGLLHKNIYKSYFFIFKEKEGDTICNEDTNLD